MLDEHRARSFFSRPSRRTNVSAPDEDGLGASTLGSDALCQEALGLDAVGAGVSVAAVGLVTGVAVGSAVGLLVKR